MVVNIPLCHDVQIIFLNLCPVRLMIIFYMGISIYLCIIKLTILCGITKLISVLSGLPFINLYAVLSVNGNSIFHCRLCCKLLLMLNISSCLVDKSV